MRTTLAMMLRGGGYEVDEASDGSDGAQQGSTGAYDIVITDLRMEARNGIDVLRAIKHAQTDDRSDRHDGVRNDRKRCRSYAPRRF